MHGSADDGVEIAATGELVPWDTVVDALRRINKATGNNLEVVAAVCFGLHAIRETIITVKKRPRVIPSPLGRSMT